MELAPKRDLIYGLQQLTGKIFKTKEILWYFNRSQPQTTRMQG